MSNDQPPLPGALEWRAAEAAFVRAREARDRAIARIMAGRVNHKPSVPEIARAFDMTPAFVHRIAKRNSGAATTGSPAVKRQNKQKGG